MSNRPVQQGPNRWRWVAITLIFLFFLLITCVTSAAWAGAIGFLIGRRSGVGMMQHRWRYDMPLPYERRFPETPDLPEMPDLPAIPEMPPFGVRPWLGVTFTMEPDGALITEVSPDSPAERVGIEVDDVITEVDGTRVTEDRPLNELILSYEPGDRVTLTVLRDGRERTIRVRLGRRLLEEMPGQPWRLPVEPEVVPD